MEYYKGKSYVWLSPDFRLALCRILVSRIVLGICYVEDSEYPKQAVVEIAFRLLYSGVKLFSSIWILNTIIT